MLGPQPISILNLSATKPIRTSIGWTKPIGGQNLLAGPNLSTNKTSLLAGQWFQEGSGFGHRGGAHTHKRRKV